MPVFCPPVDQSLAAQLAKLLSYPHFQCSLHSWACAQPEDLHTSKGWVECKGKEERGVWLFLLHRRNLQGSERGEVWINDDEPAPEVVNILKLLSPYRMLFILQQRKAKCRISFPPGDETSSPDAQACTPGTTAEDDVLSLKDDGLKKKKKKRAHIQLWQRHNSLEPCCLLADSFMLAAACSQGLLALLTPASDEHYQIHMALINY